MVERIPSILQVSGVVLALCALGMLTSLWLAVLAAGVLMAGVGYLLEPDDD